MCIDDGDICDVIEDEALYRASVIKVTVPRNLIIDFIQELYAQLSRLLTSRYNIHIAKKQEGKVW